MNRFFVCLVLALITLLAGCKKDGEESDSSEYLPQATGRPGDILIIMDSVQWRGALGKEIRDIFLEETVGLPRSEPLFNLVYVHPRKGSSLLKQIRNLVYVFTLDQQTRGARIIRDEFSPEMLDKIGTDTSYYLASATNEYARGQEVVYLFGDTEIDLINHLRRDRQKLVDYFNNLERRRLQAKISKTTSTRPITDFLRTEHQMEIRVPVGFKMVQNESDFVWLRSIEPEIDKDVFISWKPYEREYQLLPDSIMDWRDEITRNYIFEDPAVSDSYIVLEREVPFNPVRAKQVNLRDKFAMELRGLWRTNHRTMGGPFVGYALVDQQKGLMYYIEGFAYSPGKNQREIIRELEAILWTFKTSDEVAPAAARN